MSLARITLAGTVVQDPEKRYTTNTNTPVVTFTLLAPVAQAPRNSGLTGLQPSPIQVTCWRALADVVAEQIRKGEAVMVTGRLQMRPVQGPDGVQRKVFEIDASSVDKLPGGLPEPLAVNAAAANTSYAATQQAAAPQPNYSSQPYPQPQQAPMGTPAMMPQPAGVGAPQGGGFSPDLLTEDDIPF